MNIFHGLFAAFLWTLLVSLPSLAADPAAHQEHDGHLSDMTTQQTRDMFLEKKVIDGYTVSFHVMKVSPEMEHGGSHNFMVKIEKDDRILDEVVVNSKVIAPDGESHSKFLQKMGDWYMNGYDLGQEGRYQLIILFKTADGIKHSGGVYYEVAPQ